MQRLFSRARLWPALRPLAVMGVVLLAAGPAAANDKVTLRLDWVFGSEHAPIFLAKEKGFFAEEGIDVDILPGEGSTVTVKLVGNRTTDFGYASADQALLAFGHDLPTVSTAVILQTSPAAVIYPTALGIHTLKDLYGKTLGVQLRSTVDREWQAVARKQGIDLAQIHQVPADQAIAALIAAKRIDAGVAFFFNDALKLETEGIPMQWTLFADQGLPIYSTALLTNAELIKEKPELVHRFTRAFVKGWAYSTMHEKEALDLFLKANPTVDRPYSELKLPAVLKLTQGEGTAAHGIGWSSKEGWDAMQKALIDSQVLTTSVDTSKVFTNDFLK